MMSTHTHTAPRNITYWPCTDTDPPLGLYSQTSKMCYCQISSGLDAARLDIKMIVSLLKYIWQVPRQLCCRGAFQIYQRLDNFKTISSRFHEIFWWIKAVMGGECGRYRASMLWLRGCYKAMRDHVITAILPHRVLSTYYGYHAAAKGHSGVGAEPNRHWNENIVNLTTFS